MALTLKELFEKRSNPNTRICIRVACWKHAKTLIVKSDASSVFIDTREIL